MITSMVYAKHDKKYWGRFVDNSEVTHVYKSLLELIKRVGASKIYTYELGANGGVEFIRDLLANGFNYNAETLLKDNDFFYLCDTSYNFLFIRVKYNHRLINIYDLANFYNVDVSSLNSITTRLVTYKYAVQSLPDNHAYTLTGQTASEYKKYLKNHGVWFNELFERLPNNIEKFCARSFVGGICIANPKYLQQKLKVYQYDYNNLYGDILASCPLPYGQPMYVKGNAIEKTTGDYELAIQHIRARIISKSRVKWFKIKTDINFYEKTIDDSRYIIDVWLTSIDFDQLQQDYRLEELEYIDGYLFQASPCLFDDYITNNYSKKVAADNGWIEQLYKGYNNRLFGYFGKKSRHEYIEFKLTANKRLTRLPYKLDNKPIYSPLSAFVAAYGRSMVLPYIRKYYNKWVYTDCDSLFMLEPIPELPVSAELGDFKLKTGVAKIYGIKKYIFNYNTYMAGLKKQKLSYNTKPGDVIISTQTKYTTTGKAELVEYKYTI